MVDDENRPWTSVRTGRRIMGSIGAATMAGRATGRWPARFPLKHELTAHELIRACPTHHSIRLCLVRHMTNPR